MSKKRIASVTSVFAVVLGTISQAGGQQYAVARYDATSGNLYLYETDGIGVIGFENSDGFAYSDGTPMLGSQSAQALTTDVFAFFNPSGLAPGLFRLGRVLPSGLSPAQVSQVVFSYSPIGLADVLAPVEHLPVTPAAFARYNPATGELTVDVDAAAQGLLLNSDRLFNAAANPLLGVLAPSQFDASNLMFFNNDAPLPAGTFNLGAVLPPGLTASQISLATKGDGIAVGIPVTVVPEPAAAILAVASAAVAAWAIRRCRWHSLPRSG